MNNTFSHINIQTLNPETGPVLQHRGERRPRALPRAPYRRGALRPRGREQGYRSPHFLRSRVPVRIPFRGRGADSVVERDLY